MDQVDRLILQISGEEELKRLNAQLAKEDESLRQLMATQSQTVSGQGRATQVIEAAAQRIVDLNTKIDALKGQTGASGRGILGASYAIQDFTSQIQNGLGPALASVQNNIPGILTSFGAGAGLAGTISLVAVGLGVAIPLVKQFWDSLSSGGADKAKDKLDEITERIRKINAEFGKLAERPTDIEATAAQGIAGFLAEPGNLARARGAVAGITGADVAQTFLDANQQAMYQNAIRQENAAADPQTAAFYRRMRANLIRQGRERRVNQVVAGATQAGPVGAVARQVLMGVAATTPGLAGLAELSPEAIAAQEAAGEQELEQANEFGARAAAGTAGRRQERQKQRDFLRRSKREGMRLKQLTDQQIAEEEAGTRATAADNKAEAAEMNAAAAPEESRRAVNLRAARRNVAAVTQGMGLTPSPEQLDQMASSALSGMSNGLNAQQAALFSVQRKLESIQQIAMQFHAAQSRMMMGGDQNGHFPQTPAFWP